MGQPVSECRPKRRPWRRTNSPIPRRPGRRKVRIGTTAFFIVPHRAWRKRCRHERRDAGSVPPAGGGGGVGRLVDGAGLLQAGRGRGKGGGRGRAVRDGHPAPQRDGLAAPGPRPHRRHRGLPGPVAPHVRPTHAVAARHRPRRHRHADGGGEAAGQGAQRYAPRFGARGIRGRGQTVPNYIVS